MKCFALALLGSLFALTAPLGANVSSAQAGPNVAVEEFSGPGSDKVRKIAVDAAKSVAGVKVVSDKNLASATTGLGLMKAADDYAATAKKLDATHFLGGAVKGKRKNRVLITLRDASGSTVGKNTFKGRNAGAVAKDIEKKLPGLLQKWLDKGTPAAAAAKPKAPDAKPTDDKTANDVSAETDRDAEADAEAGSDADVGVAAAMAEMENDTPSQGGWTGLDVTVGSLIYSRNLAYNQLAKGPNGACSPTATAGCQQEYKTNPVAPALALAVDYYFLPFLGVTAGGEFTIGLSSQDAAGNEFATSSMGFFGGLKFKHNMDNLELNLQTTFGQHSFEVSDAKKKDSNIAAVAYQQVRAIVGLRYDLGGYALTGGGGYVHVLDMGGLNTDFPNATAMGAEANLGAAFGLGFLASGLEGRIGAVYRSYGITMDSSSKDDHIAGGATDTYLGLNIGVGYRRIN